jgi:hypothetical protein
MLRSTLLETLARSLIEDGVVDLIVVSCVLACEYEDPGSCLFDLSKSSGAPALPLGRDADHTRDSGLCNVIVNHTCVTCHVR